jgi:hypothetical protein
MRARKGKEESVAPADEREWRDWWRLRDELGRRLGKRVASGEIDPSLLKDERPASAKRGRLR